MKIISTPNPKLITPWEVKDGQICVIRVHHFDIDNIIQRVCNLQYDGFISLGKNSGHHYTGLHLITDRSVLVEILPEGTTLQI